MMIQVEHIAKQYGKNAVLKGVKLTVAEGEFVAIMGPSGSGKSTLLHLIGGLDHPDSGAITVLDHPMHALGDDQLARVRRRHIGFIFQLYNLIPVLSALENAAMPLILDRIKREAALARAAEVMDAVGLSGVRQQKPAELSGGQQQRVAIARARWCRTRR